jgi:apolipoprotein N-acyltransferase
LFHWIWTVSAFNVFDYLLLGVVYLPLYIALWTLGLALVQHHRVLPFSVFAGSLWVALEYTRSNFGFLAFPWMLLGHSQFLQHALVQVSAFTGVYGLSFLIVVVNVALAQAIRSLLRMRQINRIAVRCLAWRPLVGSSLTVLALIVYGKSVLGTVPHMSLKVAVVQANIPIGLKWHRPNREWIIQQHIDLTMKAAAEHPDLVVWPETAIPGELQLEPALQAQIADVAKRADVHLLVGSAERVKFGARDEGNRLYNSMYFLQPDGTIRGRYQKTKLVPFAEYEPSLGFVKWPAALVATMGATMAGNEFTVFELGKVHFASVICWEAIFPEVFREFVKRGAQFMIIATNEAWFADTAAPHQLLAMAVFRAAENRVAIARAANTGISAFIDPYGRIMATLTDSKGKTFNLAGELVSNVPISTTPSFYARYGDLFAFIQISLSFCTLFYVWADGVRKRMRVYAT